MKWRMVFSKIG